MRKDEILQRQLDILYEIGDLDKQVNDIPALSDKEQQRHYLIRDELIVEISLEKDEKGKPKYTNQKVRDSELRIRLSKHEEFQSLKKKILVAHKDQQPLRNRIRALHQEGKLLEIQLQMNNPYGDI